MPPPAGWACADARCPHPGAGATGGMRGPPGPLAIADQARRRAPRAPARRAPPRYALDGPVRARARRPPPSRVGEDQCASRRRRRSADGRPCRRARRGGVPSLSPASRPAWRMGSRPAARAIPPEQRRADQPCLGQRLQLDAVWPLDVLVGTPLAEVRRVEAAGANTGDWTVSELVHGYPPISPPPSRPTSPAPSGSSRS